MIITPLPAHIDTWVAARLTPPRSQGAHVSVIITAMLKELAPKKYSGYGQGKGEREPIYELGYLWEDLLGAVLTERVMLEQGEYLLTTQGEIEKEGVYGTPDRVVLAGDGSVIVEETKITWKWYTPELEDVKFLYWILQVKTYCSMIGATRARIRALFVNEISHTDPPVFVTPGCWELVWEPHELEEHWRSVTSFLAAHPELRGETAS